jgi:type I restriction enzyme M protein
MKQDDIAVKMNNASHIIEKLNPSLKGVLPDNYFSRFSPVTSELASLIDTINNIDTVANECDISEEELVDHVFEYFLDKFSASEGSGGSGFCEISSSFFTSECQMFKAA